MPRGLICFLQDVRTFAVALLTIMSCTREKASIQQRDLAVLKQKYDGRTVEGPDEFTVLRRSMAL